MKFDALKSHLDFLGFDIKQVKAFTSIKSQKHYEASTAVWTLKFASCGVKDARVKTVYLCKADAKTGTLIEEGRGKGNSIVDKLGIYFNLGN